MKQTYIVIPDEIYNISSNEIANIKPRLYAQGCNAKSFHTRKCIDGTEGGKFISQVKNSTFDL